MSRMIRSAVPIVLILLMAAPALAQRAGAAGERRDTDETVVLSGTLVEVQPPTATFESEGTRYIVHLGPTWFWNERGYEIAAGQTVTLHGQVAHEPDGEHLYLHALERGDQAYQFADADGAPLWSRAGRAGDAPTGCGRGMGRGAGAGAKAGPGVGNGRGMGQGCCMAHGAGKGAGCGGRGGCGAAASGS